MQKDRINVKILFVLSLGLLTGALNFGIASSALPLFKSIFSVDERLITWILSIFVLSYMIGALFISKMSDRYGRKRIYILNMLILLIGTIIVIFSNSYAMIIIGRIIQGFSAGGIFPMSSAIIGESFPVQKRGTALGVISAFFGFAFILGPFIGGLILQFGWQWLFIIDLPVILLIIVLGIQFLPKTKRTGLKSFDIPGIVLLGSSLALLALGINQLDVNHLLNSIESYYIWPLFVSSAILLVIWFINENKTKYPLITTKIFKSKQINLTIAIAILSGFIEIGAVFISSLAVVSLSFSNYIASLMLITVLLAITIGSPLIGLLLDKLGSRTVLLISGACSSSGLLILSFFSGNFYLFVLASTLVGFGFASVIGAPLRYIMLNEIHESDRATGQALINVSKSSGRLICSALFGAIIASKGYSIEGYNLAFLFIGIVAVIVIILSLGLKEKYEEHESLKNNY